MTNSKKLSSVPDDFSPKETSEILDQAKLLLAPALSGCMLRRFDYPIFDGWSHIELCFARSGPIVPKLILSPDPHHCLAMLFFGYSLFLRSDMNAGFEFRGANVHAWERLDAGPDAIAEAVTKRLTDFDLATAIANGTIKHIWAKRPLDGATRDFLNLGLCGIYLGEYGKAEALLRNCLSTAPNDWRADAASSAAEADPYLAKLNADPEALRRELIATMNDNWSHFKVVDPASENARP